MKRLTSNKEVSEMGMYELAHNSCYAKDRKVRFRDFENDFDARQLTTKLLEKYADIPNEFTCDDDFDDFMMDSLQYGMDDIQGLIAVFYCNLWAMADLRERLKEYEDLEEQGKLLKLPCAVGDAVYSLDRFCGGYSSDCPSRPCESCEDYQLEIYDGKFKLSDINDFGKTVFLTRQEAEDKLAEMEGKK